MSHAISLSPLSVFPVSPALLQTPNKGKNAKEMLSMAVFFPSCITQHGKCATVSMTENSSSEKPLLFLTLRTQTHSHTHYIRFSPDIPAGGICSLLRNSWHSEREYTAGICPWSPRLTGAGTAQAWQGDVSPASPAPNQPNTYRPR